MMLNNRHDDAHCVEQDRMKMIKAGMIPSFIHQSKTGSMTKRHALHNKPEERGSPTDGIMHARLKAAAFSTHLSLKGK